MAAFGALEFRIRRQMNLGLINHNCVIMLGKLQDVRVHVTEVVSPLKSCDLIDTADSVYNADTTDVT